MGAWLQFSLLFVCWLAALATLLVFLESWFALADRNRFAARRASGTYGVVSVFVPMHGSVAMLEQVIRSLFNQSYPFIELFLIHSDDDHRYIHLARDFRSARSHIPVKVVPVSFPIQSDSDRTRALEHVAAGARGRWFVTLQPDVILDRFAVESALEFGGSNEIAALALRPGVQSRGLIQKLLAPSMEYLLQMIRVIEGRREKAKKIPDESSSFLLVNREAFDIVNRINRLPGILNESGWNLWSYQVEGLRTFEGDGFQWMWREVDVRSWNPGARPALRARAFVAGSAIMAVIAVVGIVFGSTTRIESFAGASILAFSAVSYALMGISYFLYARRLRAVLWFSPLWFLAHIPAAILTLVSARSGKSRVETSAPTSPHKTSTTGPHY